MAPNIDSTDALVPKVKLSGETLTFGVSCLSLLRSGETISSVSGTPSYSPSDGSLTISGTAPNAAPFADDSLPGVTVGIGQGLLMTIAGGTPPSAGDRASGPPYTAPLVVGPNGVLYRQYTITFTVITSTSQTRQFRCLLWVPY